MERTDADVDAYLAGLSGDHRTTMQALDNVITPIMRGLSRALWTGIFWGGTEQQIIGYGDLVQQRPGGVTVEWFWIGLAEQKRYVSLYVNATREGEYLGQRYASRIGASKAGASSLSFEKLEDVDLEVLHELATDVRRIADAG